MSTRWPSWIDGALVPPGGGRIDLDDPVLLGGVGSFETLLFAEGWLHFLPRHLARMRRGLDVLGIRLQGGLEAGFERAFAAYRPTLERALAERGLIECGVRVIATRGAPGRGASLIVGAREALHVPPEGVEVVLEPRAKLARDPLEQVKTTSRVRNVLALERARASGAGEALLMNELDELCEATSANLFVVVDGRVRTPAAECGCLEGVTRESLIALLAGEGRAVDVGSVRADELERASELFLTNTTGRIVPVRGVQGVRTRLLGAAGPVTRHLRQRLAELEAADRQGRGHRPSPRA